VTRVSLFLRWRFCSEVTAMETKGSDKGIDKDSAAGNRAALRSLG
jgi:hypothetical protein